MNYRGSYVPNLRFVQFLNPWIKTKLGDVCNFYKGNILSKSNLSENGRACILYGQLYTTYRSETIKHVISKTDCNDKNLFVGKSNDVIIPASGETPEDISTACCVLSDGVLFGGDLNVLRTLHNGTFLSYQLNGKRKYDIAKLAVGKSIVHLHNDQLKNLCCYFPYDIKEEKIIALFMDTLEERIEVQNKIIENYESLIKPITEKLVKEFKCYQYRLKDISQIRKGEQIGSKLLSCQGPYPMLNGGISFSGNYVHFNRGKDTIAISEGGNSCGYVSFIEKEFWAGGHCYTIHPKRNDPDFNYCLYFILKGQEKKIMALRVGSGLPNIQKKDLENLLVNFPVPTYVRKFNAVLRSINAKVKIEKEILSKLLLLKQYLLANMFI